MKGGLRERFPDVPLQRSDAPLPMADPIARQKAEARVAAARRAVNDAGSGWNGGGTLRAKMLGEALVELDAARRALRLIARPQPIPAPVPVVRVKRLTGRPLQRARAELFKREPHCRACAKAGRTTDAAVRSHIVELCDGGTEDATNIEPLCLPCSEAKGRGKSPERTGGKPAE